MYTKVAILLATCILAEVKGHGFLQDPPQRSSAWLFGFNTPENYDHMGLNCGGFDKQWKENGGKCGTCGDPYYGARQNEAGGIYAEGVITGSYAKGSVMETKVKITAYHLGWFEFRLCAHNDVKTRVTQDCLDRTLLKVNGSGETRIDTTKFNISDSGMGIYTIQLQLPADVTCDQCVLQWKYNAGNNWGTDKDGKDCKGCGPQENFVNCADIQIKDSSTGSTTVTTNSPPPVTSSTSTTSTTTPPATTSTPTTPPPTTTTTTADEEEKSGAVCIGDPNISHCEPVGFWRQFSNMDVWCKANCVMSHCPDFICHCFC